MIDDRAIERAAGAFLLLVVVAFAVSIATFVQFDLDRVEIRDSLNAVNADQEMYAASWFGNLIGGLLLTPAAGALYLVFRLHDRALALWGLTGLLTASVAFVSATAAFFAIYFLADEFALASGQHADSIASVARALGFAGYTAWAGGTTLAGAGVLSIGLLIVRDRRMPSALGLWAMAGGAAMLVGWSVVTPLPESLDDVRRYGYYVTAGGATGTLAFFVALAAWLLAKGTPSARLR